MGLSLLGVCKGLDERGDGKLEKLFLPTFPTKTKLETSSKNQCSVSSTHSYSERISVAIVSGDGGTGKTTLLKSVAAEVRQR